VRGSTQHGADLGIPAVDTGERLHGLSTSPGEVVSPETMRSAAAEHDVRAAVLEPFSIPVAVPGGMALS
jgi:hypothetical protein